MLDVFKKKGMKVFVRHRRPYTDDINTAEILQQLFTAEEYNDVPRISCGDVPLFTRAEAEQLGFNLSNVYPNGGTTEVEVHNGDNVYKEVAICCLNDNFCRSRGVTIASGRLAKKLGLK